MNMNEREHTSIVSKVGGVFFFLWIISLGSNVLGSYQYKKEFLLISLALWVLDAFIGACRTRDATVGKRLAHGFLKMGSMSLGFWILLHTLNAIGWLEQWWGQYITYALWAALVFICAGFMLNALLSKGHVWKVRSGMYSAGGIVLLFWAVLRYQGLYAPSQDMAIVAGIALISVGFLIGAAKKEYDYPFINEAYAGIREKMVEVPVFEASDSVHVLTEESKIGNDASITINAGSLFVDIFKDAIHVGTVYFGECSYAIRTTVHTLTGHAASMVYGHGTEWNEALYGQGSRRAEQGDFARFGLTKKDIKELGLIFASNDPRAAEKFEDIIQRITETGKKVSLPFIKVFESSEGDYVKVGPIQVTDLKGKGSKVRIGNRTFVDPKDAVPHDGEHEGIAIRIRTPDNTISLVIDSHGILAEDNTFSVAITSSGESIEKGDVSYTNDGRKKIIESPFAEIVAKKDRINVKTDTLKVTIKGGLITASKAQRHIETTNEALAQLFSRRIEAFFPAVVDGALKGDKTAISHLEKSLLEELDL